VFILAQIHVSSSIFILTNSVLYKDNNEDLDLDLPKDQNNDISNNINSDNKGVLNYNIRDIINDKLDKNKIISKPSILELVGKKNKAF
jgi:hypothetical protein